MALQCTWNYALVGENCCMGPKTCVVPNVGWRCMRSGQDFSLTPHFVSSHSYSTLHPKIATVRAAQVVLMVIFGTKGAVHNLPYVLVAVFGLVSEEMQIV